jgi:hypothetical protein
MPVIIVLEQPSTTRRTLAIVTLPERHSSALTTKRFRRCRRRRRAGMAAEMGSRAGMAANSAGRASV